MSDEQTDPIVDDPTIEEDIRWFRRFVHALPGVLKKEALLAVGIPLTFFGCAVWPYILNIENNPSAAGTKDFLRTIGLGFCVAYIGVAGIFLVKQTLYQMRRD